LLSAIGGPFWCNPKNGAIHASSFDVNFEKKENKKLRIKQ